MALAIKVENVGKKYRLGTINRDMLYKDIQSWWAKMRGKPDPNAKISFIHQNRLEKGDEFWALRNINLEIEEGEIVGIIGRNGAGKSTLLKILSQITAPTEGKIHVNGRMASLLEVGTGFHPELTGRENVFINGAILGMSRSQIKAKFDEIVEFSEISEFIDTPVKRYSSGMYVRLAFGVAAHLDPDILIVDEVLAVGDAAFQKKCIGKMGSVAKEGRTVILVTHSMALAESLTKKCAWIHNGILQSSGSTKDIVSNYLNDSKNNTIDVNDGLGNYKLRRGPGHVRLNGLEILNSSGMNSSQFVRGDIIYFQMSVKVFKKIDSLSICIGFKNGGHGAILLHTEKLLIDQSYLKKSLEYKFVVKVNSEKMPSSYYDIQIWMGPHNSSILDEYFDIVDGLTAPVSIVEDESRPDAKTIVNSIICDK